MKRCNCGSYAINIERGELEDANCDVCHYKNKVTQVASEAYQVIGALASDLPHSKEVIRALDYFSAISCGENPSGEMLPFLCDWGQQSLTVAVPELNGSDDNILIPRGLIGAACSAIDKKRDAGKLLAELRRYTTGDLSKPPRITEKDMRAIVSSAMHHYIFNDQNTDINEWMSAEGQALLKKLNVKDGGV